MAGLRRVSAAVLFAAFIVPLALFSAGFAAAQVYQAAVPPRHNWSFSGVFGTYDKAQLQRGLKVYTESCSACHSLNYVRFRDLQALGYSMAQIREFAGRYSYKTINAEGDAAQRKGTPADSFPPPYANSRQAAFANSGVAPPDLALMARARAAPRAFGFITDLLTGYNSQGADYIDALLQGYAEPPQNISVPEGHYYNRYFLGGASLAMPPPLHDGLVEYNDGTVQNTQHYAEDVAAFLMWAADPHREEREKTGFSVMLFLLAALGLVYCLKREIWAGAGKGARGKTKPQEKE